MATPGEPQAVCWLQLLLLFVALSAALGASYQEQRYDCPHLSIANCTGNNGVAFYDGCKVIACIGWRSAVSEPRLCRPAIGAAELARCQRLSDRLARIQSTAAPGKGDTLVSCPEFEGLDLCTTADPFFSYHDGCNYHLCDGSGSTLERTQNTCPKAASPDHLFFCASNFNSVVRKHNSQHACSAQVKNAERICPLMWPGYRFGDICFGDNDFVCGPSGRLLMRPPANACPLADASESVKCREVAREVADLLSESRGYTCPDLQYMAVCTEENRGFVYNDGCNQVLCDGDGSGLTEGRVCKLPFDDTQVAGREYCDRQAAAVRRRIAESRRHNDPCVSPSEACASADSEGDTYFDGCNYCTCQGQGQSQCTKHPCAGFYGTRAEFFDYCNTAAFRLD